MASRIFINIPFLNKSSMTILYKSRLLLLSDLSELQITVLISKKFAYDLLNLILEKLFQLFVYLFFLSW